MVMRLRHPFQIVSGAQFKSVPQGPQKVGRGSCRARASGREAPARREPRPTNHSYSRKSQAGFLMLEMVIALCILIAVLIPVAYSFNGEQRLARQCYTRAVAMEIVDGEMELLRAGAWRDVPEGAADYPVAAAAAKNLPPGKFLLTRAGRRLRLEWSPDKARSGGKVVREINLPTP